MGLAVYTAETALRNYLTTPVIPVHLSEVDANV